MNIIETERLYLRNITLEDAPFVYELLNSPSWIKYIGDRNVKDIKDASEYIANRFLPSYQQFGFGLYLTKRKADDTPIGICGLVKRETLEDVDIGFALLPQFAKQGYAYEAASAVMLYAKNTLDLQRIVAITVSYNHNSIQLLERLGLKFEKTLNIPNDPEELMLFGN